MIDVTTRNSHLRDILFGRRQELHNDIRHRGRDGLTNHPDDVRDELEHSEADVSDDVELVYVTP